MFIMTMSNAIYQYHLSYYCSVGKVRHHSVLLASCAHIKDRYGYLQLFLSALY